MGELVQMKEWKRRDKDRVSGLVEQRVMPVADRKRKGIFIRFWAFLTRQELIYLKDFDGKLTLTLARKNHKGMIAKRWWPTNTNNVSCLDGGEVADKWNYVVGWEKA